MLTGRFWRLVDSGRSFGLLVYCAAVPLWRAALLLFCFCSADVLLFCWAASGLLLFWRWAVAGLLVVCCCFVAGLLLLWLTLIALASFRPPSRWPQVVTLFHIGDRLRMNPIGCILFCTYVLSRRRSKTLGTFGDRS